MIAKFKITGNLLDKVRNDLFRPHEFAFERVGFIYCETSMNGNLILAANFESIPDQFYLKDKFVGAKFSGEAIRLTLQKSIQTMQSVFHVHVHEHHGEPELSNVDLRSIAEILESLYTVNPSVNHGCLLLSYDCCKAYVLEEKKLVPIYTSIIGFPISIFNPEDKS